jgi:hypothetical protein
MVPVPESTLDELQSRRQDVVGQWSRRAFLAVLVVVLLAGLGGFLGVRSTTSEATEDGWSLSLEYAAVARSGLDVPWTATVSHEGGLGEQVTLALTGDYLDIYETQGFHPEPSATSRDGDTLFLTFDAPPTGDTLVVTYDAYIQPAAQRGADGTLAVRTEGREVAQVELRTRVLP